MVTFDMPCLARGLGERLQRDRHDADASISCAQAVLDFNRLTDPIAAFLRSVIASLLHLPYEFGKLLVFHAVLDPA